MSALIRNLLHSAVSAPPRYYSCGLTTDFLAWTAVAVENLRPSRQSSVECISSVAQSTTELEKIDWTTELIFPPNDWLPRLKFLPKPANELTVETSVYVRSVRSYKSHRIRQIELYDLYDPRLICVENGAEEFRLNWRKTRSLQSKISRLNFSTELKIFDCQFRRA